MGHDAQEFRFDFVGFFQFGGLNFYFLVKLRVVDRNGNLTRERVEKLNLLFVKLMALSRVKPENPQCLSLGNQRYSHIRDQTLGQIKLRSFQTRVELQPSHDQRRAAFEDDSRNLESMTPLIPLPIFFLEIAAGRLLQSAAFLVIELDGYGGVGQ
jgi:hypothetical protein